MIHNYNDIYYSLNYIYIFIYILILLKRNKTTKKTKHKRKSCETMCDCLVHLYVLVPEDGLSVDQNFDI